MLLLGINCGYGNADCGRLPIAAVNLESGWIDFARPKTGVARRSPMWPETVAALREALAKRPEPKTEEDAGLFFVTKYGQAWAKNGTNDNHANPVAAETSKLLKALGLHRPRIGFYTLRHSFRTVADEAKDQPAADLLMGHARDDMSTAPRYRSL